MKMFKTASIIGAGPAGLTAAREFQQRSDICPLVFEKSSSVGGISKTEFYKGNRIDLGGHRFFSKSDRVMSWWKQRFPVAEDCSIANSHDEVFLVRQRLSKILHKQTYFDYPLTLKECVKFGPWHLGKMSVSYLHSRIVPVRPEQNLEDFFINRFGRELYRTFFKDYTQKVWGAACNEIPAEWGEQRIKNFSITSAVKNALRLQLHKDRSIEQKSTDTTLISRFLYPKFGPGQFWEAVAHDIEAAEGRLFRKHEVVGLSHNESRITEVNVRDLQTGKEKRWQSDYFLSTMPVAELLNILDPAPPAYIQQIGQALQYRSFITIGVLLNHFNVKKDSSNNIPYHWIYIQEKAVKMGRLQIFNNWSPYMPARQDQWWIGLEYFCDENDSFWLKSDADLIEMALQELTYLKMIEKKNVLDATVIRVPKAYPSYLGSYRQMPAIREYLDHFSNLFLIGRNGMHRYNNMDHSMLTAMTAVDSIVCNRKSKAEIWAVNTDRLYHESK